MHLDQGLFDGALPSPIPLNDRRLEGLLPQLWYPQPHLASLGLQVALVMPSTRIAASLTALITLCMA
jgi:hypothetical protein